MGQTIDIGQDGGVITPDKPVIPFFPGDGTGPDIWRAAQPVLDTAVRKAYAGKASPCGALFPALVNRLRVAPLRGTLKAKRPRVGRV